MFKPHIAFLILGWALSLIFPHVQSPSFAQTAAAAVDESRDRGIELYRQKKFKEAAKSLKKAVAKNKTDEQSWYYLGLALVQLPKEFKDSSKPFETAIKLKPDFAAAHAGLSYSFLRRNKPGDALRTAQAALTLDPRLAIAHYVISVVKLNYRDHDEALREALETIRLNPKLAAGYLVKSQALLGLYGARVIALVHPPLPNPSPPTALSAEELAERRRKRKEAAVPLEEAADSLETYLKLNTADPEDKFWREQLVTLRIFSHVDLDPTSPNAILSGNEVTTKVRVLSKPEPRYTEAARRAQITGTVVLRAVFASDGTVRHFLVINYLPEGLTERAIEAARQIKFTPALLDGKPVSMFIQLEYNFNLY